MKFKIAFVVFVILFIQSCIPSLHPLWTQDKLVFEEKLIGNWGQTNAENMTLWNFSGGLDEKSNLASDYELIHREGESEASPFADPFLKKSPLATESVPEGMVDQLEDEPVTFTSLGLHKQLCSALKAKGLVTPSPVQVSHLPPTAHHIMY